jgi:hypothetical protein
LKVWQANCATAGGQKRSGRTSRFGLASRESEPKFERMTAAKVIEAMEGLAPDEQTKVIQHAFELARRRQLSADELGDLAERLENSSDPAEIIRLRSAMTGGFYGE